MRCNGYLHEMCCQPTQISHIHIMGNITVIENVLANLQKWSTSGQSSIVSGITTLITDVITPTTLLTERSTVKE